jgi:hypothetical protein
VLPSRPDVIFYGNQEGMNYYIKNNGVSFQLSRVDSWREDDNRFGMPEIKKSKVPDQISTYRVDANWIDYNPNFTVERGQELDGYNNYYNVPDGVEPALFVKQFESVLLKNVWNGINIHYYGTEGQLETDYLVTPGADYHQIQIEIKGADLSISGQGQLIIKTPFGEIQEGELKVYQGEERLQAFWKIEEGNLVSFVIPNYNSALAMRIDPLIRIWGTYYGGTNYETGRGIANDLSGNVYLSGITMSTSLISSGGYQNSFGGGTEDAFVVKFNAGGIRQWGTYYGGNNVEQISGRSVATDFNGNVFLSGLTASLTGIAIGGAHQMTFGGGPGDSFVVKFNSSGVRQWGTYFGGAGNESTGSIATDGTGNVIMTGYTSGSTSGIATSGSYQLVNGGNGDAYLVKFNSNGIRQWSTYFGGTNSDTGNDITTDINSNVYVSGSTLSTSSIASGGHQNVFGGAIDAFVAKFSSSGGMLWSTYYGGSANDYGYGISSDINGNVYLSGETSSSTSISFGGHQNTIGGGIDAFLVKFNTSGLRQWGTYYGGIGDDSNSSFEGNITNTTDVNGNVYLTGTTVSTTSIASSGYQNIFGGGCDSYLVKFNSSGLRQWGTYFGGSSSDYGHSISIDNTGNLYLSGTTTSTSSIASGGHQNSVGGLDDAFLVKFYELITIQPPSSVIACSNSMVSFGLTANSTGINYQWQFKSPSATQFSNVSAGGTNVFAGVNSATLMIGNPTGLNGYSFQCVVSLGVLSEISSISVLTVNPSPTIQSQPINSALCLGSSATFAISATGTGLLYQWQNRFGSSGAWINCSNGLVYSGSTTNSLQVLNITGLNSYQYQCVVTNSTACSIISNAATLTVNSSPLITTQPLSITSCTNQTTTFTLVASGTGLTYQWQNRNGSAGTWLNCTNGAIYNNSTTSALQILNPASLNSYQYRCIVTNNTACSVNSNVVILTVNAIPTITTQPVAISACVNQTATFTIIASGTGLSYQWQNRIGSTGTWTNCTNGTIYNGSNTNTLQILSVNGLNNYQYRCMVTNSNACSTSSNAVALTVYTTPAASITADGVGANPVIINFGDATSLVLSGAFNSSNPNIVWTPSTGLSSNSVDNPIAYPTSSTNYTATFTNTFGCTQSVSQQVNVNSLPNSGSISVVSATGFNNFNVFDTVKVEVRLVGVSNIYAAYARLRYIGPLSPYLTYVGYSAGTILGTGAAVISTPPVAFGPYGYDFGISKIGSVPGYSGTGTLYTFYFKPNNIPTNLIGSQVCFYVDNLSVTNATVDAAVGLVNQGQYCFNYSNQTVVWPGDLDNNKTVNTADLLKIGIFYNNTGPIRPNANLQWVAQPATLWGYNTSSPNSDAFMVFADGNGDGIINNVDQTSVGFNMGKIHAIAQPMDSASFDRVATTGDLVVVPTPGYVSASAQSQQLDLSVSLANAGSTLNNLYGISFDISVDTNVFDLQNTTFDYSGSIFGIPSQSFLNIEYVANGVVSVGMTRFNNSSINGNGLLCKIKLNTYPGLNYSGTNLTFNGTVSAANDSIGMPYAISPSVVQIPYGSSSSITDIGKDISQVLLYPNPAGECLNVMINEEVFVKEIKVLDETGRVVIIKTPNSIITKYTIETLNLAEGVYTIQLITKDGQIYKKFVKGD